MKNATVRILLAVVLLLVSGGLRALDAQACRVCVGTPGESLVVGRSAAGQESPLGGSDGALEQAALEQTLAALGIDYVVTDDPASDTCQLAVSYPGCGSCFTPPDLSWIQAGHGYLQISDWGAGFQPNDYQGIAEGASVNVEIVDAGHPITAGLPASWTTLGFWRYGYDDEDYYGWVTDPDPNLARVEGVDRALSARAEGAGRVVYMGWNVYGSEALSYDTAALAQAIAWAGQCSVGIEVAQEIPALSPWMLAALALALGVLGAGWVLRSRRAARP